MIDEDKLILNRIFPNISTLGSYNYLTQTVMIDSLDFDKIIHFKDSFNGEIKGSYSFYQFFQKTVPLIVHETTHWIDSVSTIWGMQFLYKLYKTYDIEDYREFLKGNADLQEFGKLLFEIRRHDYFKLHSKVKNSFPWRYQFQYLYPSDKFIIPIISFLTKDMEKIARVPISLTSLLESSAMAQELAVALSFLDILEGSDLIVERKDFIRKQVEALYTPELTEYSVAVHLVANSIHNDDILEAFRVCAVLIRLILNFPTKYFEKISLENIKNKYRFIDSGNCDNYYRTLREGKDRALLFFIISQLLSDVEIKSFQQDHIENAIKEIFEMICIAINDDFIKAVDDEMSTYQEYLLGYNYFPIEEISKAGYSNHQSIGIFGKTVYDFTSLITPTIILADNTEIDFFKNSLEKFQLRHAEHLIKAELGLLKYYEFIENQIKGNHQ